MFKNNCIVCKTHLKMEHCNKLQISSNKGWIEDKVNRVLRLVFVRKVCRRSVKVQGVITVYYMGLKHKTMWGLDCKTIRQAKSWRKNSFAGRSQMILSKWFKLEKPIIPLLIMSLSIWLLRANFSLKLYKKNNLLKKFWWRTVRVFETPDLRERYNVFNILLVKG